MKYFCWRVLQVGLTFLLTFHLNAQDTPFTFGQIPEEALRLKSCKFDTSAEAVYLFEEGFSEIKKDDRGYPAVYHTYTARIKVFTSEAAGKLSVFSLYLPKSARGNEQMSLLSAEAMSMHWDRTGGTLNKENIFTEELDDRGDKVSFAVPVVKEGSVFDIRYTLKSPFFYHFFPWSFQSEFPKQLSTYKAKIPANYEYNIVLKGPRSLDDSSQKLIRDCFYFAGVGDADCSMNTWVMKKIPAFREESYAINVENYKSSIQFELKNVERFDHSKRKYTNTWQDVEDEFFHFTPAGKASKDSDWYLKRIPEPWKNRSLDITLAQKVYRDIQTTFASGGKGSLFEDVKVREAFDTKRGTDLEQNILLLNILNALDFDADPMLLASRESGMPGRQTPTLTGFDHLVVRLAINNKIYLLDLSDKHQPFGFIPFRFLNGYGRVFPLREDSFWDDLDPRSFFSSKAVQTQFNIATGEVKLRLLTSGYFAMERRNVISQMDQQAREQYFERELGNIMEDRLTSYKVTNLDSPDDKLIEELAFKLSVNQSNTTIFDPILLKDYQDNPFQLEQREYPVDFGFPFHSNHQIIVELGDSTTISDLPDSFSVGLPDGSSKFVSTYKKMDSRIMINASLQMNRTTFAPHEYRDLKDFFSSFLSASYQRMLSLERTQGATGVRSGLE